MIPRFVRASARQRLSSTGVSGRPEGWARPSGCNRSLRFMSAMALQGWFCPFVQSHFVTPRNPRLWVLSRP